jgi:phenylacetate-CoA ligase
MNFNFLINRIYNYGINGIFKRMNPFWIIRRNKYLNEFKTLREFTLKNLALIWCGQIETSLVLKMRNELLENILNYSNANIPYYKKMFSNLNILKPNYTDLEKLPILDKSKIRDNQDSLKTPDWNKHYFYKMNTGGSTGQPLEFIVKNIAGSAAAFHQEFSFRLMGFRNGDRIAAVDGSSIPDYLIKNNIYWVSHNDSSELAYGSVSYSTHYINSKTIPYYLNSINDLGFDFILGYPSAIHRLAIYCIENNYKFLKPIKGIQLTAEIALDSQILEIEKAFDTKVYLQYGMSEVALYAHTYDSSREYLCSPFMGHVEVLNKEGKHVSINEEGVIIATGFHNSLMPFIRYNTGDRGIYGGERNGMVVLKKVLGRSQDFIHQLDGTPITLTGLVFGQHYKAFARIKKWQIIQEEWGKCTIKIIPTNGFTDEDINEITQKFYTIGKINVTIEIVENIPLTARGKHLFLIQRNN